jgi:hypothetical protein
MMVTRSEIAWPGQLSNDYVGAMLTAFCGEAIPPPAARALAATMAGMLP